MILSADIVVDVERMGTVRDALRELGYEPIEGREYYQWHRLVELPSGVKPRVRIDLLGQIPKDRSGVRVAARRMKPRGLDGFHVHPVEEAAFIHEQPLLVPVCSDPEGAAVHLPHPFNYLLLKLFAFDDRKRDAEVDFGRHHAFDLYRIVAMLTRDEWDQVRSFRETYRDAEVVAKAVRIVADGFSGGERVGALRLREHVRAQGVDLRDYPVEEFLADLSELLRPG